jgi:hypothetical protein
MDALLSSEDNFSGCLIPNKLSQELNFSFHSSKELNIFDSTDPKYSLRTYFFRNITKTQCEYEEDKMLVDKILLFHNKRENESLHTEKEEIVRNSYLGLSNN